MSNNQVRIINKYLNINNRNYVLVTNGRTDGHNGNTLKVL